MPNTTNFNFPTPADTDLVKDGALAIRNLGNSIDTAFVDLKGGTTGQVLAKNSNTDLDFTWSADASGIPATIVDAKGDIIAATAADTVSRLAVGANDTVLTADSSTATGLKWAAPASSGGMTLITTTTFNNTVSTYTYSSLGSYKHLMILLENASHTASGVDTVMCRFNSDTGTNYHWQTFGSNSNAFDSNNVNTASAIRLFYSALSQNGQANIRNGNGQAWIYDYNGSQIKNTSSANKSYNQTEQRIYSNQGTWDNTAAITSITLFTNLGNNFNSGTLKLYGVS